MAGAGAGPAKLVLGTVQFGLDYGISNSGGKVPEEEAARILEFAEAQGIRGLDTAAAYGTSEEVVGRAITGKAGAFDIISKLPAGLSPDELRASLQATLTKLGVPAIAGYLAHDAKLLRDERVREFLAEAKAAGLVGKTGVSVYRPSELEELWAEGVDPELVQIPFSVFDQRFRALFPEMKSRGIEVHARSVFLQGLYFLDPDGLAPHFRTVEGELRRLRVLAEESRIPLPHLLLGYALVEEGIDRVVFGVTSLAEIVENVKAFDYLGQVGKIKSQLDNFAVEDERVVLPILWP